jgi:NAD(P)-dependent dehydrogenase (short-subunit alcohol dehydrogenase family)/acyl carrier protein
MRFSPNSPEFLRDHRVFGRPVVPASMWCDMALRAGGENLLEDVVFHEALFLSENGEVVVHTEVSPGGTFSIFSVAEHDRRTVYASGKVDAGHSCCVHSAVQAPEASQPVPAGEFYSERALSGLMYGPAFRAITELRRFEGGVEAVVELPTVNASTSGSYRFHPVLLDGCCTAVAALFREVHRGETWVPTAIRRLEVYRRPGSWLRCIATTERPNEADLTIYDESGELVASISGFALRRVPSDFKRPLYQVDWQPAPIAPSVPDDSRRWIVVGDCAGLRTRLMGHLETTANVASASGILILSDAGERCLSTVQAAAHSRNVRLCLVTRGAVRVGSERVFPGLGESPLWGFGRVVAREYPDIDVRLIDLDPSSISDPFSALVAEFAVSGASEEIAWRDGVRHVSRLAPYAPSTPGSAGCARILPGATYLITGGLGALGSLVAAHLAARGARHLVLAGRTAPRPDAQAAVERLRDMGVEVRIEQADVSDRELTSAMLGRISAAMPPLRGVIHAAGVLDDGVLSQQSWSRFEHVFAPKARGAWNLHVLTQDTDLDFFVLFSSASALLGTPGQSNYAAANAYLDALAHYRRSIGLPALSINWGPWAEAGMAAGLHSVPGLEKIDPADALQLMEQLMADGAAQAAILPIRWQLFAGQYAGAVPSLLRDVAGVGQGNKATANGILSRLHDASPGEIRRQLRSHVREQAARVLGFSSPEEVDATRPLVDLGFDSLMGLELRNGLQSSLGCTLRSTLVFDHPTVDAIAAHIAESEFDRRPVATNGAATANGFGIDFLNDAEAESMLLHELERMNY